MTRLEFLLLIMPIVSFLGIYGIFITIRIPQTGWGIKGMLIILCLVLPGIGWLFALIVWIIRKRSLKKAEVKKEDSSEFVSSDYLLYRRLFSISKEVLIIQVSFIIGGLANKFMWIATIIHLSSGIMNKGKAELTFSILPRDSINHVHRDSIIRRRKDSVTHRILDSIIQSKIDSLKKVKMENKLRK